MPKTRPELDTLQILEEELNEHFKGPYPRITTQAGGELCITFPYSRYTLRLVKFELRKESWEEHEVRLY